MTQSELQMTAMGYCTLHDVFYLPAACTYQRTIFWQYATTTPTWLMFLPSSPPHFGDNNYV